MPDTEEDGLQLSADTPDDDNDTQDQQEPDEWVPPTRSEWSKTKRSHDRLKNDLARLKAQAAQKPSTDPDDLEAIKSQVREEEASKFHIKAMQADAKVKLAQMGAQGDLARLARMLDIDSDTDEDDVTEQLEALRQDTPSLFEARKATRTDPRLRGDAAGKPAPKHTESTNEILARQLLAGG